MLLVSRTYWAGTPFYFRRPPEKAHAEPVLLHAADRREVQGLWWTPDDSPTPRVAVVAMHPRVDFTRHYSFPRLLEAGIGCLGANTRSPNNDVDTVHEQILLDVGACVAHLRDRGVERIVLLGNSGGGSLSAFYQSQATRAPPERIRTTPAGAPTRFADADLPPADALICVSAHKGQGRIMNECIDPAVLDERDPRLTDTTLDMYDPANGFRPPPEWCEYAPDFVSRYRAAQLDRVRRLDAVARALVGETREAERLHADPEFNALPFDARQRILLAEAFEPVMVVYRTMANLHYVDRHLDPSNRDYGSLLSDRPDLMNRALTGFGRICTPRAWLSTWSGISSNADLTKTLPEVRVPTLVVHAGRDREIYPQVDARPIFEAVGAEDRTFHTCPDARHYFEPDWDPSGEPRDAPEVEALMDVVVSWIRERFEVSA